MTTYWVSMMTLRDTQIYTQIRSRQNLFSGNSLGPSASFSVKRCALLKFESLSHRLKYSGEISL